MASHFDRETTYGKDAARCFWYSIYSDVADFVKSCEVFQKQDNLTLKTKNAISTADMKQIGVDLCNLPEVAASEKCVSPASKCSC